MPDPLGDVHQHPAASNGDAAAGGGSLHLQQAAQAAAAGDHAGQIDLWRRPFTVIIDDVAQDTAGKRFAPSRAAMKLGFCVKVRARLPAGDDREPVRERDIDGATAALVNVKSIFAQLLQQGITDRLSAATSGDSPARSAH